MTVTLMTNLSEPNRVNKNVFGGAGFSGSLRNETSIIEPTIIVESGSSLSGYNYMHIPEFGRYYFITNIESIRSGIWAISGHVDVLMTYANQIRGLSGIVARQENLKNNYLPDDRMLTITDRDVYQIPFQNKLQTGGESLVFTVAG